MKIRAPGQYITPDNTPEDAISCSCGCTWMELIEVSQYNKNASFVLGQKPTTLQDGSFFLLRCARCQSLYEPSLLSGAHDLYRKEYDKFIDLMEKPLSGSKENKVFPNGEEL